MYLALVSKATCRGSSSNACGPDRTETRWVPRTNSSTVQFNSLCEGAIRVGCLGRTAGPPSSASRY